MDCRLDNLLTLAEDLLVGVMMDKSKSKKLIYALDMDCHASSRVIARAIGRDDSTL
jgi:hypothetical protein